MTPEALALLTEILDGVPSLPGAVCPDWKLTFTATTDATDPETRDYSIATALRICRSCPALQRCRDWLDSLPASQRPPGVVAGQVIPRSRPKGTPMSNNITEDDLRRGARYCVAVYESDLQVQKLVAIEVGREKRWMEHSMACALICRVVLTKVDEAEEDEGAIALWLHSAVEQLIGDGILDPRTDDEVDT